MVETVTLNYKWTKPEVTKSASTWGKFLNDGFDAIDAQVFAHYGLLANYLPLTGGSISGGLAVAGGFSVAGTAYFADANYTGSINVAGAVTAHGPITCNGFFNTNGYTVSQASGGSNAYFAMHNNVGTAMGFLIWDPGNQVVLQNNTGGGQFVLQPDGSAYVSGSLSSQGGFRTSGSISAGGNINCSNTITSVTGNFTNVNASGSVTGSYVHSSGTMSCIGAFTTSSSVAASGSISGSGLLSRAGTASGSDSNQYNFWWSGSQNTLWLNGANWGQIQTNSDYRMKKDVEPLGSMWGTVKALNPVSYTHKDWTPPSAGFQKSPSVVADNVERWGFLAHELQKPWSRAPHGVKDDPVCVQSPNPFTVIAALTRALQEAMTRIEALEAR